MVLCTVEVKEQQGEDGSCQSLVMVGQWGLVQHHEAPTSTLAVQYSSTIFRGKYEDPRSCTSVRSFASSW